MVFLTFFYKINWISRKRKWTQSLLIKTATNGALPWHYVKHLAAISSDLKRWYEQGRVRHTSSPKALLVTSAQLAVALLNAGQHPGWSDVQHTSCCSLPRTAWRKLGPPLWHVDTVPLSADWPSRRSARVSDSALISPRPCGTSDGDRHLQCTSSGDTRENALAVVASLSPNPPSRWPLQHLSWPVSHLGTCHSGDVRRGGEGHALEPHSQLLMAR